MGLLYGEGKPLRNPAWVTGSETPSQRDRRLREINEALKKNEKREQERKNRELFTQLEGQSIGTLQLSPPSPPRSPDTPLDPENEVNRWLGSQERFEGFFNSRLEGYEDTFGLTPLFGSQAYASAERLALEDWQSSQDNIPDDLLSDMQGFILDSSRDFRVAKGERPTRNVDSKYDILIDGIKADVASTLGGDQKQSLRAASDAIDMALADIEKDIRKDNPGADDQTVREQLYRTLRIQEHLSDVLDEWGWPRGEGITPPPSAWDEALRREEEDNGEFFKDFPDRPGLIEQIASVFSMKFIPTAALKSLPFTAIPLLLSSKADEEFLSLDDIHVIGQETSADPIAGLVLRGDIPVIEQGGPGGARFGTIQTGTGLAGAARAGELGFGELTGIETTTVSTALRSQLAEDILSEAISPEYIAIALPFASVGVRGLTGAPRIIRIAANLTIGTDVGLARGFPLLRPSTVRSVFRGLTSFGRNPAALLNIPRVIRNSPLFQQGIERLRRAQAHAAGIIPGADDPVRFRRVTKDLTPPQNSSTADNLPLRQAIEEDLTSGRSMEDIIESGLSAPRVEGAVPESIVRTKTTKSGLEIPESMVLQKGVIGDVLVTLSGRQRTTFKKLGSEVRERFGQTVYEVSIGRQGSGVISLPDLLEGFRGIDEVVRLNPSVKFLAEGRNVKINALLTRLGFKKTDGRFFDLSTGLQGKVGESLRARGEVTSFWRGEQGGGFLGRLANTEKNILADLQAGRPISHSSIQRVARETDLIPPELIEQSTGLELAELLQARRARETLGSRNINSLNKADLLEIAETATLRLGSKPTRGSLLKTVNSALKGEESIPKNITNRLWEAMSETDIATVFRLTAEGAVDPGALVTQLVSGKSADVLNKSRVTAFNSARSLGEREKALETYLSGVQKVADRSPVGSVKRMSLERDIRTTRWAWEVKYGVKPLEQAQTELRESLRILTTEHRGTNTERLAKLTTERANQITEEIDSFLSRFPKLSKTQKDRFAKRLLTEALDAELGVEVYDAGRQVEAMFRIAGIDRKSVEGAFEALTILTTKGTTPTSKQIADMRRALDPVLGKGATRQLLNARKLTTKGGELVLNSIGLPRALMASSDISALGRQAGIIGPRMPIQWVKMAGRSIRAFWQPEYADEVRRSIINSGVIRLEGGEVVDIYQYATKEANLFLASDAGQLGLTFREEEWMTSWASKWGWHLPRDAKGRFSLNPTQWEKVPFPVPLAQSERSYVTGLDKIRMDYFTNEMKKLVQRGMANGRPAKLDDFKDLALFTNNATGRGRLWEFLRSSTPILNALFFAPRLVASRFALIGDVARFTVKGGPMRRVVWETLAADAVALGGTMFLIDTGLRAAGLDVSIDWQNPLNKFEDADGNTVWRPNSDFMKIRVGESRLDLLASMGPIQRLLLGLGVAAYKGDGDLAAELALRFERTKEAPVASGVRDFISGEDFVGGKIEQNLDDLLTDVILSRSIPLSWQGPVEAVAAARGEIDIDIGDAIFDLVSNFPNREESITAGVVASAEFLGGGATSFFNPGEKLREADEELLQELVTKKQIEPNEGQEINQVDDLDSIQAKTLKENRDSVSKDLEKKQEEQGLWRDSEWAKNKKEEREFHEELRLTGGYTNPETGKWEALFGPGGSWRYSEIDALLLNHKIDGSEWRFRDGQNTSAEINVTRALFGREEEDIEDIDNPVDKLIAEFWDIEPIDHLTVGGDYDKEGFQAARDAKEAEISKAVGDPEVVREYFDSFTTRRDTPVQTRARAAKEDQQEFEETPVYMAGLTDVTINNLLDSTREYLNSVGSRWGLARYIQWLYYQGEQYQTNEWAVAYWVAVGERDMVLNPERTEIVFNNPDTVLFYPGLFGKLPDNDKQKFFSLHQDLLGKDLLERAIEKGEISTQSETELFQSTTVFGGS